MHTDTNPKEMPTGDGNPTAGYTDSQTVPNSVYTDKVFHSLRAALALHGHALHRTDTNGGPVAYWAERWGLVRYLPTIDTARRILEQVGGRL
jgi:hypothetical protein